MKYKFEHNGNPDYVSVHFESILVTRHVSNSTLTHENGTEEERNLYALIATCKGVSNSSPLEGIVIDPYRVCVRKAEVFEAKTVCMTVLDAVVGWLRMTGGIEDGEELIQLPTLHSNVQQMQCIECQMVRDREIAKLYNSW